MDDFLTSTMSPEWSSIRIKEKSDLKDFKKVEGGE